MNQINDCDPRYKPTEAEMRRKNFRKIGADVIQWNGDYFKIVAISSTAKRSSDNRRSLRQLELTLLEQPVVD